MERAPTNRHAATDTDPCSTGRFERGDSRSRSTGASRWRCATSDSSRPPRAGALGSEQRRELAELAQRTGHSASLLARPRPPSASRGMERLCREDAQRARREIIAFKAQLVSITANAGAS